MADHMTVNGEGKLQFSAAVKWLAGVAGGVAILVIVGSATMLIDNNNTLTLVADRLERLEQRVALLDHRIEASTQGRYETMAIIRQLEARVERLETRRQETP